MLSPSCPLSIPDYNFCGCNDWAYSERYPCLGPVLPFSTSASLCKAYAPPSDKTELLLSYETANPGQEIEGDGARRDYTPVNLTREEKPREEQGKGLAMQVRKNKVIRHSVKAH